MCVRNQIEILHSQGLRDVEIAPLVGVSRERVRQVRNKLGLPKNVVRPAYRTCRYCGGDTQILHNRICPTCKTKNQRTKYITAKCEQCGKLLVRRWVEAKRNNHVFCNRVCFGKWVCERYGFTAHPENRMHYIWKPKYFCPSCGGGAKVLTGCSGKLKNHRHRWIKAKCTVCGEVFTKSWNQPS